MKRKKSPRKALNFTKRSLESLEAPSAEDGRAIYHDTRERGLIFVVYPSGERSFVWYRKVRRRPTFRTLGPFPDLTIEQARGKASEMNARVAQGLDPFEPEGITFGVVYDRYIKEWLATEAKRPDHEMAAAEACKRYLAQWSGLPLSQLCSDDVVRLHGHLKEKHGVFAANRTLQYLKAAINWARRARLFGGNNPAAGVGIFKEPKRKRYLQPDELKRLFKTMNRSETSDDLRHFVSLALFTGARRNDLARMRWEQICMTATGEQFWAIPDPKGEPYNVPLTAPALRILAERRRERKDGNPWVFPGAGKSGHLQDPKHGWTTLRRRAKIEDVRLHDLRRTLGSWQAAQGASLHIIGKSLGHADNSGATAIYSQLQLDPVRNSMKKAARAMLLTAGRRK